MIDLGYIIRQLRIENKLTQRKLAKYMNVSISTVTAWESGGKLPSIEKLIDMARFFNVPLNYIAGIDKRKSVVLDDLTQNQQNLLLAAGLDEDTHPAVK